MLSGAFVSSMVATASLSVLVQVGGCFAILVCLGGF